MANNSDTECSADEESVSDDVTRAIQLRLIHHILTEDQKAIDRRSAMLAIKHGLFRDGFEHALPSELVESLENRSVRRRLDAGDGPFVVYANNDKRAGAFEITLGFLTVDQRLRAAALSEVLRIAELHRKAGSVFLSPHTIGKVHNLADGIKSSDQGRALASAVVAVDSIDNDFFYHLAELRQCGTYAIQDDDAKTLMSLLRPTAEGLSFLARLPAYCPYAQPSAFAELRVSILESSDIVALCYRYYRVFGHLALRGAYSLGAVIDTWLAARAGDENVWEGVSKWRLSADSPLADYHAFQLALQRPEIVPEEARKELFLDVSRFISGGESDPRMKRRCVLAKYYCHYLDSNNYGSDSAKAAAFGWWLAENVSQAIEALPIDVRGRYDLVIEDVFQSSLAVGELCFPPASPSRLRYATLLLKCLWSTSLAYEMLHSRPLDEIANESFAMEVLNSVLRRPEYCCTPEATDSLTGFAFEADVSNVVAALLKVGRCDEGVASLHERIVKLRSSRERATELIHQSHGTDKNDFVIAQWFCMLAMTGEPIGDMLFDCLESSEWRNKVLLDADTAYIDLFIRAAVENCFRDQKREWRAILPHFVALAALDAPTATRASYLFGLSIVTSLAGNSVSGVQRLLAADRTGKWDSQIREWLGKLDTCMRDATVWFAGRLRAMRAVLTVNRR